MKTTLLFISLFIANCTLAQDTTKLDPVPVYEEKDFWLFGTLAVLTLFASLLNRYLRKKRLQKSKKEQE